MPEETPEFKALQREYGREIFGVDYPEGAPHIPEVTVGDFITDEAIDIERRIIYTKLLHKGKEVANNHPDTMKRHRAFLSKAYGSVLVTGLGLGETLFELIKNPKVEYIKVLEKHYEVIHIIGQLVTGCGDRVEIVECDAFNYVPSARGEHFDFVYHAIWNDRSEVDQAQIDRLKKVFSGLAGWHGFVFDTKHGGVRRGAGRKKGVRIGPIKDPMEQRTVRKGIRFTEKEGILLSKAAEVANIKESIIMQRGAIAEAKRLLRDVAAMSDPEIRQILSGH